MSAEQRPPASSLQRRSAARTAVVWDALREVLEGITAETGRPASVVDIGGGTGGFAVRVAELGHRVTVIDPSPDALAILARRAEESGVADRVTGRQGDLDTLAAAPGADPAADPGGGLVPPGGADLVLCHGVLEIVEDPAAALDTLAGLLRPGGALSLLVSQRHAAVLARAMAGHFQQARALLDDPGEDPGENPGEHPGENPGESHRGSAGGGTGDSAHRRFTVEEVTAALATAGFDPPTLRAVRVFVDLVPSSLVDLEPGAAGALVELERAVADRPEYLALATQVLAVARRR